MRTKTKEKHQAWNRFADGGRAVLVGAAVALPRRKDANRARVSAGLCLLSVKLIAKLLKTAVPEERPNGEDNKSFPSEHAAECVAAAMMIEREYPGKIGASAYGLAASIAIARIEGKKHHPRDVLAGALIGGASVAVMLRLRLALERRMLASPA